MSNELSLESIKSRFPEGTKVTKVEFNGNIYYRTNELNIEKAAKVLKELIK